MSYAYINGMRSARYPLQGDCGCGCGGNGGCPGVGDDAEDAIIAAAAAQQTAAGKSKVSMATVGTVLGTIAVVGVAALLMPKR